MTKQELSAPLKDKLDYISDVVIRAMGDPLPTPKVSPVKNPGSKCEMLVAWSDSHFGKLTSTFNLKVLKTRVLKLEEHLKEQIKLLKPKKLHVALLGDIVDNSTIYPGQAHHIEVDVVKQYLAASDYITEFLTNLSKLVEIEVPCVRGNHGRMGKPGDNTELANWDYLVYKMLEAKLVRNKNITFHIADQWCLPYEILGKTWFLHHGDALSGGGSPQTIMNAAHKWSNALPFKWDNWLSGHFHNPYKLTLGSKNIFGNGTWVSNDTWSLTELKVLVNPSQKIFLCTKDYTSVTDFPLD